MLLVIDIGNTNTSLGVFDGERLAAHWRLTTVRARTVDEWGRTVVMVTHDPRMAAYADRIIFMKDGSVVDDTRLGADKSAEYVFEKMETMAGYEA